MTKRLFLQQEKYKIYISFFTKYLRNNFNTPISRQFKKLSIKFHYQWFISVIMLLFGDIY